MKAKYYRVVLINTETGERTLTQTTWTSRKKATEWATAFMQALKSDKADFEIKAF